MKEVKLHVETLDSLPPLDGNGAAAGPRRTKTGTGPCLIREHGRPAESADAQSMALVASAAQWRPPVGSCARAVPQPRLPGRTTDVAALIDAGLIERNEEE